MRRIGWTSAGSRRRPGRSGRAGAGLVRALLVSTFLAVVSTSLVPPAVVAQEKADPRAGELRLGTERQRIIVHPRRSTDTVQPDTDRVIDQLDKQRREDRLIQDVSPLLPRRPDLGYDVRSGFQGNRGPR
jgi:hypothetical protein